MGLRALVYNFILLTMLENFTGTTTTFFVHGVLNIEGQISVWQLIVLMNIRLEKLFVILDIRIQFKKVRKRQQLKLQLCLM